MERKIEGLELNIYYENGENESIPLTATQVMTVLNILGLKKNAPDEIICYSDDTLREFKAMKGNPLNLTSEGFC